MVPTTTFRHRFFESNAYKRIKAQFFVTAFRRQAQACNLKQPRHNFFLHFHVFWAIWNLEGGWNTKHT